MKFPPKIPTRLAFVVLMAMAVVALFIPSLPRDYSADSPHVGASVAAEIASPDPASVPVEHLSEAKDLVNLLPPSAEGADVSARPGDNRERSDNRKIAPVDFAQFSEPRDALAALAPMLRSLGLTLPGDARFSDRSEIPPAEFQFQPSAMPAEDGAPAFSARNRAQGYQVRFSKTHGFEAAAMEFDERDAFGPVYEDSLEDAHALTASAGTSLSWDWKLEVTGIGYGSQIEALPETEPAQREDSITFERGNMTEYYLNGPDGIEQRFRIAEPPRKGDGEAPLRVVMEIDTTLAPRLGSDGDAVEFLMDSGDVQLLFDRLKVTDAEGSVVPAEFEISGAGDAAHSSVISIAMNDAGAVYPLDIDPVLSQPLYHFDVTNHSSQPQLFCVFQGELYFSGHTSAAGRELWKTDGTEAGTSLVKDINPGSGGSSPGSLSFGFHELNEALYFAAVTPGEGYELWKTDGTESGTVLVTDIVPGVGSSLPGVQSHGLHELNGALYFAALTPDDGYELWKTDGTETGTVLVKDIYPGSNDSLPGSHSRGFYNRAGSLYFSARTPGEGIELWQTDGTEAGTVLVKDINPGSSSSAPGSSSWGFSQLNGEFLFSASTSVNGTELWKTDGTESGTVLIKDISSGDANSMPGNYSHGLHELDGELYFTALTPDKGYELWKTDGSEVGTVLVKDIQAGSDHSLPGMRSRGLFASGGALYFSAYTPDEGHELWRTDGSDAGTVLVADIYPGSGTSSPGETSNGFYELDGTIYFSAFTPAEGHELWKSDGTETGTVLVKDIYPGSGTSFAGASSMGLHEFGGALYFTAETADKGGELWRTDGTEIGTVLATDIELKSQPSHRT